MNGLYCPTWRTFLGVLLVICILIAANPALAQEKKPADKGPTTDEQKGKEEGQKGNPEKPPVRVKKDADEATGQSLDLFPEDEPKDTVSNIRRGMINFGGMAWVRNRVSRPQGQSRSFAASDLDVELSPHGGFLISPRIGLGLEVLFRARREEQPLAAGPPGAKKLRRDEASTVFSPQVTAYQPVVQRFYIYQRLSIGYGYAGLRSRLVDSLDQTTARQSYTMRSIEASLAVGGLIFFRPNIAGSAQLSYLYAWDQVTLDGERLFGNSYQLPTGSFRRQGLDVRIGIEVYLRGRLRPEQAKAKP